jgi:hypothetical protein
MEVQTSFGTVPELGRGFYVRRSAGLERAEKGKEGQFEKA